MRRFAQLFDELDQTTKTNQKIAALQVFFQTAEDQDKVWAIALLSHRRPKRLISTTLLKEWCMERTNISPWLFDETYHIVGDLAETIALLLPQGKRVKKSLTQWIDELIAFREAEEIDKKHFLFSAWENLEGTERFVFNKIITGGFRVGVSQKIMVKGLSKATGIEEDELAFKLTGEWNPQTINFNELIASPKENISKPYPFYLAYALDIPFDKMGGSTEWQVEYKWDGIRGQLIKRKDEVFVWSRGEELMTEKFPELESLKADLPNGVVIDGEILAWKNGQVLPFNDLQTRIGRKNLSKNILEKTPVILMAYDLLEFENEDIRHLTMQERRKLLGQVVESTNQERLKISEVINFENWNELSFFRDEKARRLGAEGIMLKRLNSSYQVGRKRGDWWKWKVEPFVIDAVLTYAMRGHGRRANLYTDYTFGLWHEGELVTFAKAYSGLTDAEIREVDQFVKKNTLEKFGPVKMVTPELVFELAFEGISKSKRHKSGFAVRFPRIHRWRKDKKPNEANSLKDLESLLPT